ADVDKRDDDVEVVVDSVLRTEERVDTPAAVEPQPYSALGERIDHSQHLFAGDHRAILTDDRNARTAARPALIGHVRSSCHGPGDIGRPSMALPPKFHGVAQAGRERGPLVIVCGLRWSV